MRIKKLLALAAALLLLASCIPARAAAAEQDVNYINLVYDDSGSMYKMGGGYFDTWCFANYAMSVFADMLGGGDTLNFYPMSVNSEPGRGSCVTVNGSMSAQRRIDTVNNAELQKDGMCDTYFSAVENAYNDLCSARTDGEKWLVVLTDGQFDTPEKLSRAEVERKLSSFVSGGVKIVYLAMGGSAAAYAPGTDPANGLYSFIAPENADVLARVTEIGNLIFEKYLFDDSYCSVANGSITLDFPVPMEQVMVFAQGENITLGSLGGRAAEDTVSVSVSEKAIPSRYGGGDRERMLADMRANSALCGCIATYSTALTVPSGRYTIPVSGTVREVQVYARPVVDIGVRFYMDDKPVTKDILELPEGVYDYEIVLLDPDTGETADTPLLNDTYGTIKTVITVNGKDSQGAAGGSVRVETDAGGSGSLEINATAVLPSGETIYANGGEGLRFSVVKEQPPRVEIELYKDGERVEAEDGLSYGEYTYAVKLLDPMLDGEADGALVSECQTTVTLTHNGETTESHELGGSFTATAGEHTISAQTVHENGETNSAKLSFTRAGELEISLEGGEFELESLESGTAVARVTLDGMPLTSRQWESAELSAASPRLAWEAEKGSELGTWLMHPRYNDNDMLSTAAGDVRVELTARVDTGTGMTEGMRESRVHIKNISLFRRIAEWVKMNPVLAAALLAAAVIAAGYIPGVKKYLPRLKPVARAGKNLKHIKKVNIEMGKSIWPYAAVHATLNPNVTGRSDVPTLRIRGAGGDRMELLNGRALATAKAYVNAVMPAEDKVVIDTSSNIRWTADRMKYTFVFYDK